MPGNDVKCHLNCYVDVGMLTQAKVSRNAIRGFFHEDLGDVAALWAKVFAPGGTVSLGLLESYLEELFLASPWAACNSGSLVYEDSDGTIAGFLGVMPRRMRFQSEPITVAVATQLMVDPDKRLPFASFELLKTLFAGPQDLTFSDGANYLAQDLWEAAGGKMAMVYSSVWTRILRPAQWAAQQCEKRKLLNPIPRLLRPVCRPLDAAATSLPNSPYRLKEASGIVTEECATPEALLACVREYSAKRTLRPDYDLASFQWLLRHAADQRSHGELKREILRNELGNILGWYVYYVKPGGVSQVLQVGGKQRQIGEVIQHLFYRAHREGAVAVSGQLEPSFARTLARNHCSFTWSGGVLLHARNERISNVIHRGDAFLTRLEGEWWMRFCDMTTAQAGH